MKRPPSELSRAWLLKAHSDLHTARQIGGLPDGHLDAGIYHCQQAAEKALKGFRGKSASKGGQTMKTFEGLSSQAGFTREIKPSLREYESLLARGERLST